MSTPQPIPQIRPYRRFLTSALHRRFVHASALALIVCWDNAFWIGKKSSCECIWQRRGRVLTLSRFLVMVPTQLNRCSSDPPFRVLSSGLHTPRGFIAARSSSHHIPF